MNEIRTGDRFRIPDNSVVVEVIEDMAAQSFWDAYDLAELKVVEDPTGRWGKGYIYDEEYQELSNPNYYQPVKEPIEMLFKRSKK